MPDMTITPNEARSQEVYSRVQDLRTTAAQDLLSSHNLNSQNQSPAVKARLEKIIASNKENTA